jgi:hypothetical protein
MTYKNYDICKFYGYYLVIKVDEYDYEQIPFISIKDTQDFIDLPESKKEEIRESYRN